MTAGAVALKNFSVVGKITIKADGRTLVYRQHVVGDNIDDMLRDALVLLERTQIRHHPIIDPHSGRPVVVRNLIVCISSVGMPEVCTLPINGLVHDVYAITERVIAEQVYPWVFPHNYEEPDHRLWEVTLMRAQAFIQLFKGLGRHRRR